MKPSFNLHVIPVFLALAGVARANVLVVAQGGAAPFTEIQAAIDVAQDGDTVLVRSGSYGSFVARNHSISIVADIGHSVFVEGAIRVGGISAERSLLISGLTANGVNTLSGFGPYGASVLNCAGHVRFQNCTLTGAVGSSAVAHTSGWAGARVESGADVTFASCTLRGGLGLNGLCCSGDPTNPFEPGVAGEGLLALSSTVACWNSAFVGGNGQPGGDCNRPDGGSGGPGIRSTQSTVFLSRCSAQGGNGGGVSVALVSACCSSGVDGGAGGNGLVTHSAADLVRLLETTLVGGFRGNYLSGFCGVHFGTQVSAIVGFGQVVVLGGAGRTATATAVAREGQSWTLTLSGQPGETVRIFMSQASQAVWIPIWSTVLHVPIPRPLGIDSAPPVIPASGTLSLSFPVTELGAGVESRRWFVQPQFLGPGGTKRLGTPSGFVLLDSAF